MSAYYRPATRTINIGVWLLIGITVSLTAVLSLRDLVGRRTESATQPAKQIPPVTYTTYVLLGVGATADANPNVEAVWLAVLPSDHSAVELIGLPPARFEGQYSPESGLRPDSLEPYLRGAFAGALVFDRNAISEFVNRLGGVWLAGKQVSGTEALNFIDAANPNQPDDVLMRQAAVLQGVLAQLALAGTHVNYVSLFDSATFLSMDRGALFDVLSQYYPVKTNLVRVHLADNR